MKTLRSVPGCASSIARLWPPVLCAAVLTGSAGARADAPFDAELREHAEAILAAPRSDASVLHLLQMQRLSGDVDAELARALHAKLAEDRRLDPQLRVRAQHRLAWDLRRSGDVEASRQAFDALGYVRDFRVIGPFDNEGKRGFDETMPVEQELDQPRNLNAAYQGKERMVRWRALPDVVRGGYVSFDALLSPNENVCGFAETQLHSDEARPMTLWVGAGGAFKVYFNGREVLRDEAYRGAFPNRHVASVAARKGLNRVLVKVCATDGTGGFFLRTGDRAGEPLPLRADLQDASEVAPAELRTPRAPRTWLERFQARAEAKGAGAQALSDYARFLWLTSSDDPARRWAKTYALRAVEAGQKPTAERLLLAASLSDERHEQMRLVGRAKALAPDDREVALRQALLVRDGPEPERALGMLAQIDTAGTTGLKAVRHRARVLTDLGMAEAALALLEAHAERAPEARRWRWARAEALRAVGRNGEARELTEELLADHADLVAARRTLFRHALRNGEVAEAVGHADSVRLLYPANANRLLEVSRMYEAAERDDLKFAVLGELRELNPQASRAHVAYGRALLRAQRTEAAAEAFRTALSLSPQDAETRELLEQLDPEPRLDESYATDAETLLARRQDADGHPVQVLTNLNVNTVFENGLGSRFVQFAAQAQDAEGARALRARSIQFDPETQRVDVRLARVYRKDGQVLDATQTYVQQLGEPWYRIYYDTRALVVVFPNLEPGDSIELRYRIDDVAHRNQFADYYGDMHFFQGDDPQAHVEYVLIAPRSRTLHFNQPQMAGLQHEVREEEDKRIHRYWAEDVEALSPEPAMPGATEVIPYLHVSTYADWSQVARWYWGLIKDQLVADDALQATVRELTQGAEDDREVVERIYGWVIRNTRYVGLEFGIHGFLPYRVPDVVRRGFGDCKDKASLIYTMLREAGIDARIVLVRTRRNGAIDPLPASLAVFDHAIAYVPELDLFLDGTAEHHGSTELPFGDQGVQVLIVGPEDSRLTTTPVLPAERNVRERTLRIALSPSGSAELQAQETIRGGDAPSYRSRYQAEGTQAERLERSLAGRHPGLSLESHELTGLDELESTVGLRYTLRVPQLAQRDGRSLRVAPSVLESLARQMARTPERSYPLELGQRHVYVEDRHILLPKGYALSGAPKGGEARSPFGSLSLRIEPHGEEIVVGTRLEMNVARVAPEDYGAFRRWVQDADQLLKQRIRISPSQP